MVQRRAEEAVVVDVSQRFVTACSTNVSWKEAVEEIGEAAGSGYDCGFAFIHEFFVTEGMDTVMEALREKLGVTNLVGCAVPGALGQAVGLDAIQASAGGPGGDWPPMEAEQGPVISVGLLRDPGASPFFLGAGAEGDLELLNRRAAKGDVRSILLLSDPFAPCEDILSSLDESFPNAVKAGGLGSALQVGGDERLAYMPSLGIASEGIPYRAHSQGVVGLLLSAFDIHTIVCQGCLGVGPAVKVSQVDGQVCSGIGGRPAAEAMKLIFSAVDEKTRAKMQRFLTVGLADPKENYQQVGEGDWLIRTISGVTPQGGLLIGTGVEEDQPLRFHVRDRESAEADLALMLKRYRLERMLAKWEEPVGAFLFTCNGRGEGLFGRRHVDSRAVAEVLGDVASARVAGFFCNGEIGSPGLAVPHARGEERSKKAEPLRGTAIHGFTAVYALLVPAPLAAS